INLCVFTGTQEASPCSRAARCRIANNNTTCVVWQIKGFHQRESDITARNAQIAIVDKAILDECLSNFLYKIAGDGKTHTCTAARSADNLRVNPNDPPFKIKQGAATVTRINGRIRLNN